MNEIRWTDKVYLDSQGNFQYSNNTDQMTQDYIRDLIVISYNEIESNIELQSVGMVSA